MTKFRLMKILSILFALEGALLIIYGLATGANFIVIVFSLIDMGASLTSGKEIYVILGMFRLMLAIHDITSKNNARSQVVYGILLVFSSIAGMTILLFESAITVFNVISIATFVPSLLYLRCARGQVRFEPHKNEKTKFPTIPTNDTNIWTLVERRELNAKLEEFGVYTPKDEDEFDS